MIRWRPILTAEDVIISVISMLQDPNINSPANIDAAVNKYNNKKDIIPWRLPSLQKVSENVHRKIVGKYLKILIKNYILYKFDYIKIFNYLKINHSIMVQDFSLLQ